METFTTSTPQARICALVPEGEMLFAALEGQALAKAAYQGRVEYADYAERESVCVLWFPGEQLALVQLRDCGENPLRVTGCQSIQDAINAYWR